MTSIYKAEGLTTDLDHDETSARVISSLVIDGFLIVGDIESLDSCSESSTHKGGTGDNSRLHFEKDIVVDMLGSINCLFCKGRWFYIDVKTTQLRSEERHLYIAVSKWTRTHRPFHQNRFCSISTQKTKVMCRSFDSVHSNLHPLTIMDPFWIIRFEVRTKRPTANPHVSSASQLPLADIDIGP